MHFRKLYLLPILFLLIACNLQPENNAGSLVRLKKHLKEDWAMHKLWDDGLAEVAVYDAARVVYGKKREFEFTMITVKEDFNSEHNVKTDNYNRDDLFPVMKINQLCRIPTDNYPYHYMTSVFVNRQYSWDLHKLTSSSQEWCGNTFKSITRGRNFILNYSSYFDGQGEGTWQLPTDLLFEDQLPYSLRALRFESKPTFNVTIAETQQTNKATPPEEYEATITTTEATIEGKAVWLVNVQLAPNKLNKYWFATAYPNTLIRQKTWDGRTLELKKISRDAYWQGN